MLVLNLLLDLMKIKNLLDPFDKLRSPLHGGFGGAKLYINIPYIKSTYIAKNALLTNPIKSRVKMLIKNYGVTLWEFRVTLWEFRVTLWEFESLFQC